MPDNETTGFLDVLKEFAESSTWHGIPKIASSRQLAVKVLWCVVLLIALGGVSLQLYDLFDTYNSHPVQTKVSLEFSALQFPAITVCNMNPVRKSQLYLAPELKEAIYPKKKKKNPSRTTREKRQSATVNDTLDLVLHENTANVTDHSEHFNGTMFDSGDDMLYALGDARNHTGYDDYEYHDYFDFYYSNYFIDIFDHDDEESGGNETEPILTDSSFDENMYKQVSEAEHFQDPKDKWEAKAMRIKTLFRNESLEIRQRIGHQKEDFILRALFNKRQQNITKHFSEFSSSQYGNCFTLDESRYHTFKSGIDHGIHLALYLEVDEYIENHSSGYGVRIVFHESGSFPMPTEEGLTLNPGFETHLGLRAINITRLDHPYGDCTYGLDFKNKYNVTYSKTACLEFCRIETISELCDCMPHYTPDILKPFLGGVPVCKEGDTFDEFCVYHVDHYFTETGCVCKNPCTEFKYQLTISGRSWPNKAYLEKVLMRELCAKNIKSSEKACFQINNDSAMFDYDRYRNNFARVLIYFEDLNYETITEEPSYTPVRFISDIGGTVGLFLGASILSFFELLQLLLEIVLHLKQPQGQTEPAIPIKV